MHVPANDYMHGVVWCGGYIFHQASASHCQYNLVLIGNNKPYGRGRLWQTKSSIYSLVQTAAWNLLLQLMQSNGFY
jgi:hypothetical protein